MTDERGPGQPGFGETVGAFLMGAVVWGAIEKGGGAGVAVAAILNAWLHQPWTRTLLNICLWLVIPYLIGWGLFSVSELHRVAASRREGVPPRSLPAPTAILATPATPTALPDRDAWQRHQTPPPTQEGSQKDGAARARDWLDALLEPPHHGTDDETDASAEDAYDEFEPMRSFRLSSVQDVIGAHRPLRVGEEFVVVTDSEGQPLTADPDGLVHTRWFTITAYASPEALESGSSPTGQSQAETLLDLQEVVAEMRRPPSTKWNIHNAP